MFSVMLGQNALSEQCTFRSVNDRPTPRLPAVTQRMRLRSPGLRFFSTGSFVGFSNTSSCALLAFSIGLISGGRLS